MVKHILFRLSIIASVITGILLSLLGSGFNRDIEEFGDVLALLSWLSNHIFAVVVVLFLSAVAMFIEGFFLQRRGERGKRNFNWIFASISGLLFILCMLV